MATIEEKSDESAWPSEPKHYQWKGTITEQENMWYVLAHCKPKKEDVFIKIRCFKGDSDLDQFTSITTKLINIRHPNLMTPIHAFVFKTEIFVIYPRHSGGPNGIENEDIVACILYDAALGLQNLHKHQQCHRDIRADSLHVDIDEGIALLSNFDTLKDIKFKHASQKKNTVAEHNEFTDPLLGIDENATWYTGDIYAFGITALQLTYGFPPEINNDPLMGDKPTFPSTEMYERVCPFNKSFEALIKDCCGPLADRISVKQLVEHKFFKHADCPNPEAINKFLGHILKSTEKRINTEIETPPPSMVQKIHSLHNESAIDDGAMDNPSGDMFAPPVTEENIEGVLIQQSSKDDFKWSFSVGNVLDVGNEQIVDNAVNATNDETQEIENPESAPTAFESKDSKEEEEEEGASNVKQDPISNAVEPGASEMTSADDEKTDDSKPSESPEIKETETEMESEKSSTKTVVPGAELDDHKEVEPDHDDKLKHSKPKKMKKKKSMKRVNSKRRKSLKKTEIKKWMEDHDVFERTLYDTLISNKIESSKQLKALKQKDLDAILQSVRVTRLAKAKDKKKQKAVESELVHFEKLVNLKDKKKAEKKKGGHKKKGGDTNGGGTKNHKKKKTQKKSDGDKKETKTKKKGTKKAVKKSKK